MENSKGNDNIWNKFQPESIGLNSEVIKACDPRYFNHILVHTGQNWDYTLNQVFFEEFELRKT